jgi:Holliday junction resolvasome RuvABC endonuclease subunit
MRIIGIDPSLRNFGIVQAELDPQTLDFKIGEMRLVESEDNATKAKTVRKNSDDLRRASILFEGMVEAVTGASFAFVEVPVGSQSARAMASYGICIGVLAACPIPIIQVTPGEVKQAATGYKTAEKSEMIAAAVKEFPEAKWLTRKVKGEVKLVNDNEHLADACYAIKAGLRSAEFKSALAMFRAAHSAA